MSTTTHHTTTSRRRPRRPAAQPAGKGPGGPSGPERITLANLDDHIDERIDTEVTKSTFAILMSGFAVLMAAVAAITILVIGADSGDDATAAADAGVAQEAEAPAGAVDISAEAGEGIDYEAYQRPDPTLPAVPEGDVKKFRIDVYEHVTKVSDDLAPTRVWSFAVNGKFNRVTGVSEPMVVVSTLSRDSLLVAYRLDNGQNLWQYPSEGSGS